MYQSKIKKEERRVLLFIGSVRYISSPVISRNGQTKPGARHSVYISLWRTWTQVLEPSYSLTFSRGNSDLKQCVREVNLHTDMSVSQAKLNMLFYNADPYKLFHFNKHLLKIVFLLEYFPSHCFLYLLCCLPFPSIFLCFHLYHFFFWQIMNLHDIASAK